jgi:ribosomal protein S21
MSTTQIIVQKNSGESNTSVLRRFTKKVQETRLIQKVKGQRYNLREKSDLVRKKGALRRIAKNKETDRLKKLGKIKE